MLTLGFTNYYYTLWSVHTFTRYGAGQVVNGSFSGECFQVTKYQYLQNLSMDYEEAKIKITNMAGEGNWEEDLSLRGDFGHSFEKTKRFIANLADWQFTFGKLFCHDIRSCNDVWQLNRAMTQEDKPRTRVYARRRLIELGELIRYTWTERRFNQTLCDKWWIENGANADIMQPTHDMFCTDVKLNYATPRQVERMEKAKKEAAASGHFFKDGEKVTIEIKEVERFGFETQWGFTHIVKYETPDGKLLKYMGASPPDLPEAEFVKVKATIKHSEYKGQKETKLQRIKEEKNSCKILK